jgi:hypothetical protein
MGGECRTQEMREMHKQILPNSRRKYEYKHLDEEGTDGRILKWTLKNWKGG